MIEETVIVSSVDDGHVMVESTPKSACASCEQRSGCSSSVLSKFVKQRYVEVETRLPLQPGDRVVVGIDEGALVMGSLLLYIAPLVAMFLGAILCQFMISPDILSQDLCGILGAAIGFMLAFGYIRNSQQAFMQRYRVKPVVIRKV